MNPAYTILYFQFFFDFRHENCFAKARRQETMASNGIFIIDYEIYYVNKVIIEKYGSKELVLLDNGGFWFTNNNQAHDFTSSVGSGLRDELINRGYGKELSHTV